MWTDDPHQSGPFRWLVLLITMLMSRKWGSYGKNRWENKIFIRMFKKIKGKLKKRKIHYLKLKTH
jgi:hypothetical protein